jgi:S1/P1 Nuclease
MARAQQIRLMVTVSLLVWLAPTKLLGWGRDGHAIIATLAEAHLTESARLGVKALLKDQSLASVSSWADEVRPQRDETYDWHFVDIPKNAAAFDEARDCYRPDDNHAEAQTDHHNCVVDRIGMFQQVLMNPSASETERVEALKFIVHFVGDVHQPLHAIGEARGGNDIKISEFGSTQCGPHPCNLHGAWDSGLIAHADLGQQEYVQHLEQLISEQHLTASGNPEDWANESHEYAQAAWLVDGGQVDENYYKAQIKVVDTRLALAGLRLAALLNDVFGRGK